MISPPGLADIPMYGIFGRCPLRRKIEFFQDHIVYMRILFFAVTGLPESGGWGPDVWKDILPDGIDLHLFWKNLVNNLATETIFTAPQPSKRAGQCLGRAFSAFRVRQDIFQDILYRFRLAWC